MLPRDSLGGNTSPPTTSTEAIHSKWQPVKPGPQPENCGLTRRWLHLLDQNSIVVLSDLWSIDRRIRRRFKKLLLRVKIAELEIANLRSKLAARSTGSAVEVPCGR